MSRSLRSGIFVGIAFLLGSINVLYHSVFYALLVVALVLNLIADWKGFWQEARQHRNYLLLPVIGVVYLCIHYLLSLCWGGLPYKASWSTVELLMLYFFFIPVYVVSMKKWITVSLLKRFLLALCWGILVFNTVKFFYITGTGIFTDFSATLQMVYATRFGGNMELLKGFVLLEPQAFYLAVSGIVSYFYLLYCVCFKTGRATFISCLIIFIFSLLFLSFTVTRASILAFSAGFCLLSAVFLWKFSFRQRIIFLGGILFLLISVYWGAPASFKLRMQEMKADIATLAEGEILAGGTVAPRMAMWTEDFARFKEWGLFGLGLYKKYGVREWYQQSQYTSITDLRNTHNSFLDFWILGGIPGLFFLCFYFFAPLWDMVKQRKYSILVIALIIALVIANNTCLLIALMDSVPLILFLFALFFFCLECFIQAEQKGGRTKSIV